MAASTEMFAVHTQNQASKHTHTHQVGHKRTLLVVLPQAMFVDFGMAAQYDGNCYLRFDDTNPEAEKQEYIDHILVRR